MKKQIVKSNTACVLGLMRQSLCAELRVLSLASCSILRRAPTIRTYDWLLGTLVDYCASITCLVTGSLVFSMINFFLFMFYVSKKYMVTKWLYGNVSLVFTNRIGSFTILVLIMVLAESSLRSKRILPPTSTTSAILLLFMAAPPVPASIRVPTPRCTTIFIITTFPTPTLPSSHARSTWTSLQPTTNLRNLWFGY